MGQIVKRKKKGRPSKADLAHRAAEASERDLRRSLRRRSVRYNFDFDEYIDDEEDEDADDDDDDEIGREKKLKLVLKLQNKESGGAESDPSRTRGVDHAPTGSASSSGSEDGHKPLKKRKIDGDDEIEVDLDDEIDDADDEVREHKTDTKEAGSVPGTPPEPSRGFPLPDKKSLELMLDKLQKKDTYGVYAEPVDPEELPDYHDVIEHPMDFATVRKKLANGSYSTLEQFENDVFLICSNAMQYNAPDTVYHKQARSIQELAIKKFQRIKIEIERSNKELKSEQNPISDSLGKTLIKKPMIKTLQEPVGSDFSSGATLATIGDFQHGSNAIQAGGGERPANVDGIVERNSSLIDNSLDKAEDLLSGKGLFSKFGRKPLVNEENRRSTYNISNNPPVGSESILTTFDSEIKQLVSVGLHADHSYARSLARFAATLGPVAWKVASRRIEQALPPGSKFGRGWVGEYEPLPTPVLMLGNGTRKELTSLAKLTATSDARKDDVTSKMLVTTKEQSISVPTSEGMSSLLGPNGSKPTVTLSTSTLAPSVRGANLDGKPSFLCSTGARPYQQQNLQPRNPEPERKVILKQVELNSPPSSAYQKATGFLAEKQVLNGSEVAASRSVETISRNGNVLQSVPFKQLDSNEVVSGALPNGKVLTSDRNKMVSSSTHSSVPNQMVRAANYFPHGQEQGLSDPVQLMRMLAENAQKQQKSSNHSSVENPSISSSRIDDSSNAAAAAARAWMSIGAGGFKPGAENANKNHISADSLYNSTRELHPQVSRFRGEFPVSGVHFQHEKNSSPVQAFVGSPVRLGNEAQLQNRPMVFPQLVTADLSRFHVQSPWRGLNPQTQLRQKQESLPPDLNIGFPSTGSPGRQSSGVLVDSQQPDLALQL